MYIYVHISQIYIYMNIGMSIFNTYTPEYSLKNIPYPSHHAFQI